MQNQETKSVTIDILAKTKVKKIISAKRSYKFKLIQENLKVKSKWYLKLKL